MKMDIATIVGHVTLMITTITGFWLAYKRDKLRNELERVYHEKEYAKLNVQIGRNGDTGK